MKIAFLIAFWVSLLMVLINGLFEWPVGYQIGKPVIMLSLIGYYVSSVNKEHRSLAVLAAMSASWLGDVLLMDPTLFIAGLIAFLSAHLLYIFAYRQHRTAPTENELAGLHRLRLAFPIVLAGSGLVIVLYPVLNGMRVPVMIYALVITVMVLQALFRFGRTSFSSFWMVFFGALLFMGSDAILAVNKFLTPISGADLLIMVFYGAGQFLIVEGLIHHFEKATH